MATQKQEQHHANGQSKAKHAKAKANSAAQGPINTALAQGSTVRVKIYAQDPMVEPGLVDIDIPGLDLDSGPKDAQFIVVDQDLSSGVTYEQARFLQNKNAFDD